jgi:hypothetical protein
MLELVDRLVLGTSAFMHVGSTPTRGTMILTYFIIGIVYVLINGFIRKIYTDDDILLPMVHMFMWPMFVIMLLISKLKKS